MRDVFSRGAIVRGWLTEPLVEKLGKEEGRKALLMFSDGEDDSSSHDMMTAIETAQGANVVVYTVRYTEKAHSKLTARNQYGIRVMERIAKETGGEAIDGEKTDSTYLLSPDRRGITELV